MHILWFEQTLADIRSEADWLSSAELARLTGMRIPKRREDWRLGRWTAKHAVAAYLGFPVSPSTLAAIEVRPAESGAPEVFLDSRPAPVAVAISHRDGHAACAVAAAGGELGCDLEIAEPRCDAFVSDYFTAQEQNLVAQVSAANRFRLLALLWSAKESALKAMQAGLRIETLSIAVDLGKDCGKIDEALSSAPESPSPTELWHPFRAIYSAEQRFRGWWQHNGELIRTLVSVPASLPPVFSTPRALANDVV
jgi:4'-phosphopantetheinyl transferase